MKLANKFFKKKKANKKRLNIQTIVVIAAVMALSLVYINLVTSPKIVVSGQTFTVELADTAESRTQGLSGRQSLDQDAGMLFVFEQSGYHAFWMLDMLFDLDIIWINEDQEVVFIEQNIPPDSYPDAFVSDYPARYVLEVNSGVVKTLDLRVGDRLDFVGI